jgi:hypothetical protein
MAEGNKNNDREDHLGAMEIEVQQAVQANRSIKPIASPAIIERCLAAWRSLEALDDADWDQVAPRLGDEIELLQALFATRRRRR